MTPSDQHITRIIKWQKGATSLLHTDLTGIETTPADIGCFWHSDLTKLCRTQNAVGLAANQVDCEMNFFFIAASAKLTPATTGHVCICPVWAPADDSVQYLTDEGCKSLEGQYRVSRYDTIQASWTAMNGHRITRKLKGYAAQVFQHEHDHLRGITLMESGSKI